MTDFRRKTAFEGVVALKQTDKALLCEIEDKKVWVPQSQIDDDSEVYKEGQKGTLVVSEWYAHEKGLI